MVLHSSLRGYVSAEDYPFFEREFIKLVNKYQKKKWERTIKQNLCLKKSL